jgi:hypothetical protein
MYFPFNLIFRFGVGQCFSVETFEFKLIGTQMNSEFHSIIIIIKIATSSGTKIAEQQEIVIEQEHKILIIQLFN